MYVGAPARWRAAIASVRAEWQVCAGDRAGSPRLRDEFADMHAGAGCGRRVGRELLP